MTKEKIMDTDDIATFRERLSAVTAGLLGTQGGAARMVPMSHQLRNEDPWIWFITARDTLLALEAAAGPVAAHYMIAEGGKGLYAVIAGQLSRNDDPALLEALWSTVADSWFEGGKSDPAVCVIGLEPTSAEVWLTPTSGLAFAFNIVRAQVTGKEPDMGSHGTLSAAELARFGTAG
jgi:general stress protein 26